MTSISDKVLFLVFQLRGHSCLQEKEARKEAELAAQMEAALEGGA